MPSAPKAARASLSHLRGRPLPWTIREQIASLRAAGATIRGIAHFLSLSTATVQKYLYTSLIQKHSQANIRRDNRQ